MGPTGSVCHIDCQLECDAEPCPQVRARYPQWLRWEYCTHTCSCPDCQCEHWVHHDGIHAAPVHQVEDSEDEAACQPTLQIHGPAPVRQVEDSEVEAACQPTQPSQKVAIPCLAQGCWYITEKDEPAIAFEFFKQHQAACQPTQPSQKVAIPY